MQTGFPLQSEREEISKVRDRNQTYREQTITSTRPGPGSTRPGLDLALAQVDSASWTKICMDLRQSVRINGGAIVETGQMAVPENHKKIIAQLFVYEGAKSSAPMDAMVPGERRLPGAAH